MSTFGIILLIVVLVAGWVMLWSSVCNTFYSTIYLIYQALETIKKELQKLNNDLPEEDTK
jgi:hypothetical protein